MGDRPPSDPSAAPLLFTPLRLRDLTLANRIVISPMCQHACNDGRANDWHLVHLGKFALGGAGLIFTESAAVSPHGRIGLHDLGLWDDGQIAPLARIVDFVHAQGSCLGVQISHAGRKAGCQPLWEGGRAYTPAELTQIAGPVGWRRLAPSAIPAGLEWSAPEAVDDAGMAEVIEAFSAATRRAQAAGFDCLELHFAHGYLAASFLSPLSNQRTDEYGGSRENRMRFPLRIARAVRCHWPGSKPLFCRISAVDGAEGGWDLSDSVVLAQALSALGVDVIDVSSGGLGEETHRLAVPRGLGFQVDFAAIVRQQAGAIVQAVGMIVDGPQAESILASGAADLIAIGRAALDDPYWPRRAYEQLTGQTNYASWPVRHGAWLARREQGMGPLLRARKDSLK